MHKNITSRSGRTLNTCNQYWLLHDNNHYHSINNIKAFLAVDYFCPHCFQGFTNKKAFDNHKCEQCEEGVCNKKKKKQVKSSRIGKDIAHYLNRQDMKGGKDEVDGKIDQLKRILEKENEDVNTEENRKYLERKRQLFTEKAEHPTYIVYDFEADVHTLTHKPNHVDVDVLTVGNTHNYADCKHDTFTYSGYDVVDKFCDWLFTSHHSHSTVIAHNQAGYDGRFILQW